MEIVASQMHVATLHFSLCVTEKKFPLKDGHFSFAMEIVASQMHVATLHFSLCVTNEMESSSTS